MPAPSSARRQTLQKGQWKALYVPEDYTYEWPDGRKPPNRSKIQKVETLYNIGQTQWKLTLGDIICLPFTGQVWTGGGVNRTRGPRFEISQGLRNSVSYLLRGSAAYRVADILPVFHRDSAGLPDLEDPERYEGFTLEKPYGEILHARPATEAFAAQMVSEELMAERRAATHPSAGLHAVATESADPAKGGVSWANLNGGTIRNVHKILVDKMPLFWALIYHVALPKPSNPNKKRRPHEASTKPRRTRPVVSAAQRALESAKRTAYAVTRAISTVLYSHNRRVKLLPVAEGILYFASRVPQMVYDYGSRVSSIPSLSEMHRIMAILGVREINKIKMLYQRSGYLVKIVMDNVQHYLRAHESRVWRTNKLVYGTAATSIEMDFIEDISAFDIDRKEAAIANDDREHTLQDFHALIDTEHLLGVNDLHWVKALVTAIPELQHLQPDVDQLFSELPGSLAVPHDHQTMTHSLQSNGRNETIFPDLKAAILDYLAQHGITKQTFKRQLVLFGGDGLTFEKILALKRFLQTKLCPFDSLRILYPYLESWHMTWTDLSRTCATHWGKLELKDPSTLAMCANRVGVKAPTNLGKVDYYKYSETVFLILLARMLDCWRYV
jgi:hypothetical protein